MHWIFNPGWSAEELTYAYSRRFSPTPVFVQKEDHIENQKDTTSSQGYDNINLLTRQLLGSGTAITTCCAFENPGAPLITITPALTPDENGALRFDDYVEVVLYRGGINVWRLWKQDGAITWKRLLGAEFPVSEGEKHTLCVEVADKVLKIQADAWCFQLRVEDLFDQFHIGINACEGICRFWSLDIEKSLKSC